uniref:Uncharacterized protein n=1 Tax=Panagrolaimus sp. ES5 TaxID=591445 RepID=A0AC34F4R5_9BILA
MSLRGGSGSSIRGRRGETNSNNVGGSRPFESKGGNFRYKGGGTYSDGIKSKTSLTNTPSILSNSKDLGPGMLFLYIQKLSFL